MDVDKIISKIRNGDFKDVKRFIKKNPDKVNQINSRSKTFLMAACEQGSTSLIAFLIESGANIDMSDKEGLTALHYAVKRHKTDAVAFLVSSGANVNKQTSGGNTPLHWAAGKNYEDVVKVLLNSKENNNLQVNQGNNRGQTALYYACRYGQINIVELLLQQNGIDVNAVKEDGSTALHVACEEGHTDVVELLLQQNGSDICPVTNHGHTPLHIASAYGRTEVVELLLQQNGINANKVDEDGDTPLHLAVQKQHHDVVASMLAQDSVKLDIANNDKRTPLLEAVSAIHIGIVHKLITCGANMNAIDKDGNNCLHIAAEKEEFCSEKEHITILDECCDKLGLPTEKRLSNVGVAGYLAHQGANLYRKNNKNVAPLDLIEVAVLKEKFKVLFPPQKCMLCEENEASMELQPCAHTVLCEDCSKIQLKRCPKCKTCIESKRRVECPKCKEKVKSFVCPKFEEKAVQTVAESVDSVTVEQIHLHRVSQKLAGKWMELGRELGIDQTDLEIIRHDYPQSVREQGFQMLLKWWRSTDPEKRTLPILKAALERTECYDALECLSSEFN